MILSLMAGFGRLDARLDPLVAAASVFLFFGTVAVVLIVERTMGLNRAVGKG